MKFSEPSVGALILCAGSGSRTNLAYNKILYRIGKKTVLETVLDKFSDSCVQKIRITANSADKKAIEEIASYYKESGRIKDISVVEGGDTRAKSVKAGLRAISDCDIVVIHDGARPYLSPALIDATVLSAKKYGSGIAAVKEIDSVKEVAGNRIAKSLDRNKIYRMQTPQTFDYKLIRDAYEHATEDYTDDSAVFDAAGHSPVIVEGEYANRKVTTVTDLFDAAPARSRIGVGFDVHELTTGRKLILGGVEIPHSKGLEGHSDADALAHAITDAILSAAALPDIGVLFPDDDPATLGISSMILLEKVVTKAEELGYSVGNVSAVIMAQKPKMAPFIPEMRKTLAKHLHTDFERVNVSATTTEGLGIIGEEKGIAASATCLLFY